MSKVIGMRKLEASGIGYGEQADAEIRRLINEAYDRAKQLLTENPDSLEGVASALLDRETLDGEEVRKIVRQAAVKAAA
jgi:cell division protease FtsH